MPFPISRSRAWIALSLTSLTTAAAILMLPWICSANLLNRTKLVVYTEGTNSSRQNHTTRPSGKKPLFSGGRLVVMTNQYSASASEITSGVYPRLGPRTGGGTAHVWQGTRATTNPLPRRLDDTPYRGSLLYPYRTRHTEAIYQGGSESLS